jgi:4-hydroxymandelate oxidase
VDAARPGSGREPGGGTLRLTAVARRRFDPPAAIAGRPDHQDRLHAYLSDLVRPYGLTLRGSSAGCGHSYGEMAAALIRELVPPQRPVDLLVLAFAVPDVRPGRATATYLSRVCPGNPFAFAICDQGSAAAFTGLRLLEEYGRGCGYERSLLLVVEQSAVPYDAGVPVDLPTAHTAVGIRCGAGGPARVRSVRQHAGVPPDRVTGLLSGEVAAAAGRTGAVTVIADPYLAAGLAGDPALGGVRAAPAGQPHTGVWWELAGLWGRLGARPPGDRRSRRPEHRLVLAGYDRQLGYLSVSTVDVDP